MKFGKKPLTFNKQISQLIDRGLVIDNAEKAEFVLSHINYYRLSAYWYPFEENHSKHQFYPNVTFEQVVESYVFDRSLRLLVLDAIERIEVSIKTQWAHHMSLAYGSHAYTIYNKSLCKKEHHFRKNLDSIKKQVENSEEVFISHFKDNYDDDLPPIWAVVEVLSLGMVSRLYSNLKAYQVRTDIAKTYQLDETYLEGFLEHLTYLRNICAHHGRLWNKHLVKKMPLPRGKPVNLRDNMYFDVLHQSEHKLYNSLVMIQHLMTLISPQSSWALRLSDLIEKYCINTTAMGFPEDWQDRTIWQAAVKTIAPKKKE